MKHVLHLECLICQRRYQPDELAYVCPEHGNEGILEVAYDYDRIAATLSREEMQACRDRTIRRYRALLPVRPDSPFPPAAVGGTPIYPLPDLRRRLGLEHVWVKDEGLQPTGSLKDRASAVAAVKAREAGADVLTTASTGNAAAALAGICAGTGQPCVIFVPETAPAAKLAQLLAYGATVLLVKGTYDEAFDLCLRASAEYGWYNRSTGFNPYMSEGKKTAAFEICEQLDWRAPDALLVSVGDGCIIGGLFKGMRDLKALGWTDRLPRLIGVQAEGSNFLAAAWETGEDVLTKSPIAARTVADSICVGLPRDRLKALAAVRQSGGAFVTVSDEQILAAIPSLARAAGVFAEPAGAAAFAGLLEARERKLVDPEERIVVLNTGNGLKDIPGVMESVRRMGDEGQPVEPDFERARDVLESLAAGPERLRRSPL